MRKTTGAVLCTRCRRLVSVHEKVCPYCGARNPGLSGYGPALQKLFRDTVDPVTWVSGACVGLYLVSVALDPSAVMGGGLLGFGSPADRSLYLLGMTGGLAWRHGAYWTALTAVFLHGSLLHIVFNLSWVRSIGPLAVESFGKARFFVIFCLTGIGGFLVSNLLGAPPSIGASGAIFGLMGALLAYGRRRGGTWGRGVSKNAMAWAASGLIFSLAMPGVNNLAHLGGFVSGFALGYLLPYAERAEESRASQLGALFLGLAALAGIVLSALSFARGFGQIGV